MVGKCHHDPRHNGHRHTSYFSHNVLLVITAEYTQRNVNYVIKFTLDKLKHIFN